MTMDFWDAQKKAHLKTGFAIFLFLCMTLGIAIFSEAIFRVFAGEDYEEPFPFVAVLFILVTVATAIFQYFMYRTQGGSYVAESLGGVKVAPDSRDPKKTQLYHIVEEMAIASSIPMPAVYVLQEPAINAFAAGLTQDKAAIAITQGALNVLSRDEISGVIAHECSHIKNGDMRMGMQLAALIAGFFVLLYISFRILDFSRFQREESNKGNMTVLVAIIFLAAGSLAWFGGTLLKSLVSRQREYLADASAVQFTRNPDGLIGALLKIKHENTHEMPKYGKPFEHLYFDGSSSLFGLFDSHPPLDNRIAVLRGLK